MQNQNCLMLNVCLLIFKVIYLAKFLRFRVYKTLSERLLEWLRSFVTAKICFKKRHRLPSDDIKYFLTAVGRKIEAMHCCLQCNQSLQSYLAYNNKCDVSRPAHTVTTMRIKIIAIFQLLSLGVL